MKKVAIIGVGHVGSTVAYTLISRGSIDQLVLFDQKESLITAEINDLIDGQIGQKNQVELLEPQLDALADCDLIIFSAGDITIFEGNSDRFAELTLTKKIVEEWAPKIKHAGFNGLLLNITNPCDVITQYLQELTELPRQQVFGTGTTLDTARMKHAVSKQLNIHPSSIEGYVLGEHGESQFVAWSSVRIGGIPIVETFTSSELEQLDKDARNGGWLTFSGKGYTSYGIANQAADIAHAALNNSQLVAPVSNYSEKDACYVGHPAQISRQGITKDFAIFLAPSEQEKWQKTIETIHYMHTTIKNG